MRSTGTGPGSASSAGSSRAWTPLASVLWVLLLVARASLGPEQPPPQPATVSAARTIVNLEDARTAAKITRDAGPSRARTMRSDRLPARKCPYTCCEGRLDAASAACTVKCTCTVFHGHVSPWSAGRTAAWSALRRRARPLYGVPVAAREAVLEDAAPAARIGACRLGAGVRSSAPCLQPPNRSASTRA